jgi:regulator of protease activity HflC (stomatin/prohibitin superfamily)
MAEITSFVVLRHLRAEQSSHVITFRGGRLRRTGRGISLWFFPLSTTIAEIPVDDRELSFIFHGRSADFQDVAVQGVITYRVANASTLAQRVDFGIDLQRGVHLKQPFEKIGLLLTQLSQQFVWTYLAQTPIRDILADGYRVIREQIATGLHADEGLSGLGLEIVSVRVSSLAPTSDLEKALEMPMREKIQQEADEATFARRALAVEKERAIQENALQNQIELSRREEQLIAQQGQNERRRVGEEAEAKGMAAEAEARRARIESSAKADGIRAIASAEVEGERARMEIYKELPSSVLVGLAAQELAKKLQRIDHINITPELLAPLLGNLIEAGTARLGKRS